jgi:hypothetical protein
MINFKIFQLKKSKSFLGKIPIVLGENAFLIFLGLLLLSLASGGIVFFRYYTLSEKEIPKITDGQLQFDNKTYQEILEIWGKRDREFEKTTLKEYLSPFMPPSS